MLTPAGDAAALAQAIERLLDDDPLRRALGRNDASDAAIRFDVRRQVDDYLEFYRDVMRRWQSPVAAA
jgi:glycosyltransferase involved in cell wall biosynthesis